MPTDKGRTYRLYNCFRNDLEEASTENDVLSVLTGLLPSFNANTAAILIQPEQHRSSYLVGHQTGERSLWTEYRSLCQADQKSLSRLLRLCTYPIAFSEVEHQAHLHKRLRTLHELLAKQDYSDALAVPLFAQQSQHSAMIFAGRDLTLLPSKRHWMIQTAADVAARIAAIRQATEAFDRYQLTARQLEVAPWLVEGKSDWEIGQILKISKRLNN